MQATRHVHASSADSHCRIHSRCRSSSSTFFFRSFRSGSLSSSSAAACANASIASPSLTWRLAVLGLIERRPKRAAEACPKTRSQPCAQVWYGDRQQDFPEAVWVYLNARSSEPAPATRHARAWPPSGRPRGASAMTPNTLRRPDRPLFRHGKHLRCRRPREPRGDADRGPRRRRPHEPRSSFVSRSRRRTSRIDESRCGPLEPTGGLLLASHVATRHRYGSVHPTPAPAGRRSPARPRHERATRTGETRRTSIDLGTQRASCARPGGSNRERTSAAQGQRACALRARCAAMIRIATRGFANRRKNCTRPERDWSARHRGSSSPARSSR